MKTFQTTTTGKSGVKHDRCTLGGKEQNVLYYIMYQLVRVRGAKINQYRNSVKFLLLFVTVQQLVSSYSSLIVVCKNQIN